MGRGKPKVTLTKMADRGKDELGRHYWRIRAPDPATGRRTTVEAGRWTPAEAQERLEVIAARLRLGLSPEDDSTKPWTVSELVGAYTEEMSTRLGDGHHYVGHETRRLAHVVAHIGSLQADRLTRQRLEQYVAARRRDPCRTGRPVTRKSLTEEVLSLLRAYRSMRELGRIGCDVPPMPSMKSVPDDRRPQRRLTEAEVAKILRAAEAEDLAHAFEPAEGTHSRRIFDLVAARPGISTEELRAEVGTVAIWNIARALRNQGKLRQLDDRWFPAERRPELGLWALFTTLAWSGRRPVAVFAVRRRDCDRLLEEGLPRAERLMYWSTDKGGVGRGWGPLPEPAYKALVARAREVDDPEARLWQSPSGQPWTAVRINRMFARMVTRAELADVQVYDLRRFAITRILSAVGGQTAVARRFTGHNTDQALLRYAFAPQGEAEDVAKEIGWSSPLALANRHQER